MECLGFHRHPQVMDLVKRAAGPIETAAALRATYTEVSEGLSAAGLTIGGSEALDDRLYIKQKGSLVYSEEELDIVEKADYRLGLMHSVRSRAGTDQDSPAGLRS